MGSQRPRLARLKGDSRNAVCDNQIRLSNGDGDVLLTKEGGSIAKNVKRPSVRSRPQCQRPIGQDVYFSSSQSDGSNALLIRRYLVFRTTYRVRRAAISI